jgi:hypothetical protein
MVKARKGSMAKRVAVNLIALYAFLLQSVFAGPAIAAYDAPSGVICSQNKSGPQGSDGAHHRHGICCILACAASASIFVAASAGILFFPPRAGSYLDLAPPPFAVTHAAAQFYPPPRGPPPAL